METAELSQYDGNEEQTEEEVLHSFNAEILDGAHDGSMDFVKAEGLVEGSELLDGEEVVMEALSSLPDGSVELQVIQCEDDSSDMLDIDPRQRKIDKDDPRSRLHYIKYLKKEGKPLKMWECGICGKEFRHQYTLMRHLPTHTDERNYKCEDCGKAFRQMSTLSQHRAIHSDARPYVCDCCQKTFNRVSTLISHRKTHSDLKPHKCPVCFKGFHQKGNLRNHVFTHTNERPYKCEICQKGFNQMSNLVCHKAHVHGDKSRHVCTMCGTEFLRRYALRLHEEYTHGIVYRGGNRVQLKQEMLDESSTTDNEEKPASRRNLRIINLPPQSSQSGRATKSKHSTLKQTTKALEMETKVVTPSSEVIIDPIETKAMKTAKDSGQTTFALFKPAKGIPVLVKVMSAPNNKQMLVPATVEDLKSAGKITVSPNYDSANNGSPIKAVQIKVPVVATVIQRVGENGQLTISVESPGPEQAPDASSPVAEETPLEVLSEEAEAEAVTMDEGNVVHYVDDEGSVVAMDDSEEGEVQYLEDDGTLMGDEQEMFKEEQEVAEYVLGDAGSGLMELDTGGEIQLVRASEDGTYEVVSEEEAALLLQNQDQTIQVLDDNTDVQFQEMLEEGDDGEILVNQNNLSALVSAIRSAGYEVLPGEEGALEGCIEDETLNMEPEVQLNLEDPAGMVTFKIEDN